MPVRGPGRDHQAHDRTGGDDGHGHPLSGVQRPRVGRGDQGQQTGEPHRRHDRAPPGRGTRPAADEQRRHRQGHHDGQRAQRLHQAQRTERQRHHVQYAAETVEPDRRPPARPAQRRVLLARRRLRHPLLHDRPARVRDGGDEGQQDGQREGAHRLLLCVRRGRSARRGERWAFMTNTLPCPGLPVVVPEHSLGPTADGVRGDPRHPQGGRPWGGAPGRIP